MRHEALEDELEELSSAEDFLQFFAIDADPAVVFVNRLHILQRFHDYLEKDTEGPGAGEDWHGYYARHLRAAYEDFVGSDARTEKVFKIFQDQQPKKPVFVPLESLVKKGGEG